MVELSYIIDLLLLATAMAEQRIFLTRVLTVR